MDALKIIANGFVLTCDPQNRGGAYNLLIRNGRIAEISDSLDLFTALHPYATIIDASGKLIVPGFVNAHFHSDSVLLQARTNGMHFGLWKHDIRFQECDKKLLEPGSYDDVRSLYLASYFSHLKSGVTSVGEFGPPVDSKGLIQLLQAIDRTEVKSVVTLQNWDQIRQANELGPKRPKFMVSIGREEDFTVYSFENLTRAARDLGVPLIAHLAEQRDDVEIVKKNFQKNALALLRDYNALQPGTLLVHLNHVTESEIDLVEQLSATVAIAPRSTAFKQTGYPALRSLTRRNVRLCISTDWANQDVLLELRFLHELPLLVSGIRQLSPMELLRMATINGAYALGLSAETGSIEPGKSADLTFFNLSDIRVPFTASRPTAEELALLLVRSLTSRDISDVMIDGEFYVGRGEIMTMSEEDVVEGFRKTFDRFFPVSSRPLPSEPEELAAERPAGTRGKVLPFVPEQRVPAEGVEGFEEGFQIIQPPPGVFEIKNNSVNMQPPPALPPPKAPGPKPELSKDVKRIFGEDEGF